MNPDREVVQAAHALTLWFRGVSVEINHLSRNVASLLESSLAGRSTVNKGALVGLEELAHEFLTRNASAIGAGMFFATDSIDEGGRPREWWTREPDGALKRLDFDSTPGSRRYYDYEKLPFFSAAASTGEQTLWGPYVDYLGFEDYILTVSAPFWVRGRFMGVVGCDIRLRDLEPLIMPTLRLIHDNAALINASNRVILGNSGMYLVGERVRSESAHQHRLALDVPHLGLSLIYTTTT
ncbi:cache domain-containing protein [Cryobacterium sp. PH29-G1]|uniref:cache domain-containing protein n=1 Tax=Cryobacterium sp. PH29-G1 TaxID=3046211 RepID=UPI0024BA6D57|nr:cache domain-containing protein [Cryobacterium sp. PH29-G1]MDJ0348128.1 cache domain-containing protein [Cryobacterium sp. PH29-G1]